MFCVCILPNYHFSIYNHLNKTKNSKVTYLRLLMVFVRSLSFDTDPDSGFSQLLIRIRIQGNDADSTDPDPQHWTWCPCPSCCPCVAKDSDLSNVLSLCS